MKLINIIYTTIFFTTLAFSQTSMCFKENHKDLSTISNTALDGGECKGLYSLEDMKKQNWKIEDINISQNKNKKTYIYIFKKNETTISSLDEEKIEKRIMQRLKERKKQEVEEKKQEIKYTMSKNGKELYINKCQKCHGINADIKAQNTSRPLVDLNYSDMKTAIRDYTLDDYDRGRAFLMKPYALMLSNRNLKNVYSYIQSLSKEKKVEKDKKKNDKKKQEKKKKEETK